MTLLVAVAALAGELLGRSSRAVTDEMTILVAVAALDDTRIGAISLGVTYGMWWLVRLIVIMMI